MRHSLAPTKSHPKAFTCLSEHEITGCRQSSCLVAAAMPDNFSGHAGQEELRGAAEAADEPVVKGKGRHGRDSGANREEMDRERFMQVGPL